MNVKYMPFLYLSVLQEKVYRKVIDIFNVKSIFKRSIVYKVYKKACGGAKKTHTKIAQFVKFPNECNSISSSL